VLGKLDGLSEYEVRRPRTPTGTNLLGLVKHLAVVENAWVIPEEAGVWLEAEIEVVGTEGIARVHIPGDLSLWLSRGHVLPDTTLVPFVLGTSTGALRDELSYLATCIVRQTKPERVAPDDGIEAVRLAVAAAESGARGTPVVLREPAGAG